MNVSGMNLTCMRLLYYDKTEKTEPRICYNRQALVGQKCGTMYFNSNQVATHIVIPRGIYKTFVP